MGMRSSKGKFGIVAGNNTWARRFMAGTIIQGAIIVGLTAFLVLGLILI